MLLVILVLIELSSIGITAEVLRAKVDWIGIFEGTGSGQFGPKFQVGLQGVIPNHRTRPRTAYGRKIPLWRKWRERMFALFTRNME